MQIKVNGISEKIEAEQITVSEFLFHKKVNTTQGLAMAINNQVIPQNEWNETIICENDSVLIIRAAQGG